MHGIRRVEGDEERFYSHAGYYKSLKASHVLPDAHRSLLALSPLVAQ